MTTEAPEKTPGLLAFGFPDDAEHVPQSPYDKGGKFYCNCRCGEYEGRGVSTPSHAYSSTRVHAEHANAHGYTPLAAPSTPRAAAPPRPRTGSPATSRPRAGTGAPTPCGCGCGGASRGLFCPGHDSKFKGMLKAAKQSGVTISHPVTYEQADPVEIAKFLDERRGGGTFWLDKVIG